MLNFLGGKTVLFKCFSVVGWVAILCAVALTLWTNFGPTKPVPDKARQKIADEAVQQMVRELRENRGSIKRVVLFYFSNDPSGYITDNLRAQLNAKGTVLMPLI